MSESGGDDGIRIRVSLLGSEEDDVRIQGR